MNAIDIAHRQSERVSALLLWCPHLRSEDAEGFGFLRRALPALTHEEISQLVAVKAYGFTEEGQRFAEQLERSKPEEWGPGIESYAGMNVTDEAATIEAPTLIMYPGDGPDLLHELASEVAAVIPKATMRVIPTASSRYENGNIDAQTAAIVDFLGELEGAAVDDAEVAASSFQTILFTDLESSTALTQRVGDEAAQEVLRGHNTAVRGALESNGGREVKHTGDGIMASFPSAVSAVEASLAIQRELEGSEVRVRIGINAGEPIAEDDDLFGTAVQLAARITDRAEPGQVLVSRVVMNLCAGKQFEFTSAGDATMKGFDEPVALYAVGA